MSAEVMREAAKEIRADWPTGDSCPNECGCEDEPVLVGYHHDAAFHQAVAGWLEAEASAHEALTLFTSAAASIEHEVNIRGAALTIRKGDDGGVSMQADTSAPALAVARAYLGDPS